MLGFLKKKLGKKKHRERKPRDREAGLLGDLENARDVSSRHFSYNDLIDFYYEQRETRPDALQKCIEYCQADILHIMPFLKKCEHEFGDIPRIPSFERLAIIYEKQGRYSEAIGICRKAISLGLWDGTKGRFEGRLERLNQKLLQAQGG